MVQDKTAAEGPVGPPAAGESELRPFIPEPGGARTVPRGFHGVRSHPGTGREGVRRNCRIPKALVVPPAGSYNSNFMKRLLLPVLLLCTSCTPMTPPASYWHLTIPISAGAAGDADRLIRETVPLFNEVADAWARRGATKSGAQELLGKARKVERNLATALMTYLSLTPDEQNRETIERRAGGLQELLAAIRTCIREIESSL